MSSAPARGAPLTIDEVAERWRMSRDGVYRLMAKGELPWLQVSAKRRLIALEDVEKYEQGVRRASSPLASPATDMENRGPSSGAKTDAVIVASRAKLRKPVRARL